MRPTPIKVLVVYDVQVKTPEVSQVPLVLNYGKDPIPLPHVHVQLTDLLCQISQKPSRSTRIGPLFCIHLRLIGADGFHSVAPAIASSYTRAGVVINFVTATGGDVEMLRSIECFYK